MANETGNKPERPYILPIEIIKGIKFTRREVDIMVCILGRRPTKKIASFLHISPKTVESHMGKALKHMREQLKDYLPTLFWVVWFLKIWMD